MDVRADSVVGRAVGEGVRAARANVLPGAILISCGIALVLAYYGLGEVRAVLNEVGRFKEAWGFWFSIPSTAFFGGVLPLLLRRILLRQACSGTDLVFGVVFWAVKGFEVDLLYRLQAQVFGEGRDFWTVAPKVLVDQFGYVMLIAAPTMVLGYLWKACGYRVSEVRLALREKGYWARALQVMIPNWAVWIPAVTIIYLFPVALQLPLQNLTLTIWVMLLVLLTRK